MPIISAFVMGLRRRARLRATFVEIAFLGGAAIATAVIGVVAPASTAVAAIPLPGISYSGPSAHGDYTVELQPRCAGGATTCANPSILYVEVTPVKEPAVCQESGGVVNDYVFGPGGAGVPLVHGSFAVTDEFARGVKLAISGTFTSAAHVRGTITGLRRCGSDTYSVVLPATVAPCAVFTKAHAATEFSLGYRAQPSYGDLNGVGADCTQTFSSPQDPSAATLTYRSRSSFAALDLATPTTSTPVAGLGPNAALDFSSETYGESQTITLVFHRSTAWAYLEFAVVVEGTCSATAPCAYPSPGRGIVQGRLLALARSLYASMG
jgi:hypothetical protein